MDKPLMKMRPDIINSLFPIFARNLVYSFVVVLFMYVFFQVLVLYGIIYISTSHLIFMLFLLMLILAIIPLTIRLIILLNTTYYFYRDRVISEFEFVVIRKYSLPYNKIVNITVEVSVWDRITRAGDIVLHTPEDKKPDLVLKYIRNPKKVERRIYDLIDSRQKRKE